MTTYYAYDRGLPCQNVSCKSNGKPHPNCRCYGDMAEGGEVEPYCSKDQPHRNDCEYYADGGIVGTLRDIEPSHAVAGHIFNHGILGILKMDFDKDLNKYDSSVKKGHKNLESVIHHVFESDKRLDDEDRSRHHEAIEKWMAKGGVVHNLHQEIYNQNSGPQEFAKGGAVHKEGHGVLHGHPVEQAYPEQNILLQGAKGRVSNYLSSLKPQENSPRLAFDDSPDQSSKKRSYKIALKIADHPMSLMRDLHKGTLDKEHMQHFQALYPELKEAMQKKVTEKIIRSQLDGKKPNRKIRQSLSLFMGAPLSGEFTPQGIMAAQATFLNKKNPSQQQAPDQANKPKKNTAPLSKSDNAYLTGGQSLVARQQKES